VPNDVYGACNRRADFLSLFVCVQRGLVLLLFGGMGIGSTFTGWGAISSIVGIIVFIWGIMYIIGHFLTCLPAPTPIIGGGSCAMCSCITEPCTRVCAGRGAIN
jgi:hypothetical protein